MNLTVELALPSVDPTVSQVRAVSAGQKDWKFSTQLQDGELYYRTKLSGSLIVTGDDFAWLDAQRERFPCCVEVEVNVFSPNCDTGDLELFWPGYFKIDAVRFDYTACSAEVREVLPRDGYDALFRAWQKPVNLLQNDPQRVSFVALYRDHYVSSIDSDGNQTIGVPEGNSPGTGWQNAEHVYTNGIRLNYALDTLLTLSITGTKASFIPGITSSFYFATANPVTGRKNLEKVILAGSDAKRPVSIDNADILTTTLKDFLSDLRALHNVYYMLDPETGHLRLEHYSWFAQRSYANLNRVSLNLTLYPDALKAANNESVDLDSLFGVEELVITNNSPSYFAEYRTASVRYDDGCTVKDDKGEVKKNTITVEKIWTDIYAGYSSPESVPDDSIFLCDIVPAGTIPQVVSQLPQLAVASNNAEYPNYSSVLVKIGTNGYQSAALLFIDFHRHGRSFTQGVVNAIKQDDGSYANGLQMAMLSTTNTRRQEGISIPICCTDLPINLNGYVKTNRFAQGRLDKGVFDPNADTLTLDVVAGSRCQQVIVTPADPGSDCPPAGHIITGYSQQTYCDFEQQIVATNTDIIIYADGNCGTYELANPTYSTGNC
ncbi:hypothetical protein [Spirosoma litoris]